MDSSTRRINSHLGANWTGRRRDARRPASASSDVVQGRRAGLPAPGPGGPRRDRARRARARTRACPPSGVLAKRLAVSRTTVVSAYEKLRADRSASRAAGAAEPACAAALARPAGCGCTRTRRAPSGGTRSTAAWSTGRAARSSSWARTCRRPDLLAGELARVDEKEIRELPRGPGLPPDGAAGAASRRSRATSRGWGVATTEEQVLVTHGAQQAIGLAGRPVPRARRHRGRRGPDVSRLDRHLHRARRAPGRRAGRGRRGVGRAGAGDSSRARRRG